MRVGVRMLTFVNGRSVAFLAVTCTPFAAAAQERPPIEELRWQEDWSSLADPARRTRPLDRLKHIPLSDDPETYVSLGVHLRERLEANDARNLGADGTAGDIYVLQRAQVHADFHLNARWRAFVQIEDARAPGKRMVAPIDENPIDLRLAFVDYRADELTVRVGRQDLDVGRERFLSVREGPNVRQSFEAVWAEWRAGPWRYVAFTTSPVDHRPGAPFNDRRERSIGLASARIERSLGNTGTLTAWYGAYRNGQARNGILTGRERRHVLDVRWAGGGRQWDWDMEAMGQIGRLDDRRIRAWALGAKIGKVLAETSLAPRLALQLDYATGDGASDNRRMGTFNPLFPDGAYFTLGDYTAYANLIHLRPSVTIVPARRFTLTGAAGLQWRQSISDAVYVQPAIPIPRTAGRGGQWTGYYGRARLDWQWRPEVKIGVEAVRYESGRTLRDAGASNGNYLGLQLATDW